MGVCFWKREARFLFLLLLWHGTALDEYSTFPLPPETQAKSDDPNPITPYASGSTLFAVKPIIIITKKKKCESESEMKNLKSKSKSATVLSSLLSPKEKKKKRKRKKAQYGR